MNCHDAQLMISAFLEEKMDDEQTETFLKHIEQCSDCYDELEVYYMITAGLMELDEKPNETLDFKNNLKELIADRKLQIASRRKTKRRLKDVREVTILCVMFAGILLYYIFLYSGFSIRTVEEFTATVGEIIEHDLFGYAAGNPAEVPALDDVCNEFEQKYPLIPSYIYPETENLTDLEEIMKHE